MVDEARTGTLCSQKPAKLLLEQQDRVDPNEIQQLLEGLDFDASAAGLEDAERAAEACEPFGP